MHDDADLMTFVASMGGERQLRVEENLGDGFVRLRVAEAERRQAKHDIRCVEDIVIEMLRNARDAGAKHIYVATSREQDIRTITMLDDGSGIPQNLQERIFDARVTSKLESVHMDRWGVHGRGMALFSVKENAQEARVVSSDVGKGSSIQVVVDCTSLPERADQSTWPRIGVNDDGNSTVKRGPHNIIRTCCEFALEERDTCALYLGSPAEIITTARFRVRPSISSGDLLFIDDLERLPVLERLYVASDARELAEVAQRLGLSISERTAHRIIVGDIRPIKSVYQRLTKRETNDTHHEIDLSRDCRSLKVSPEDAEQFTRMLERDFEFIAQRYYLTLLSAPVIRVSRGKITATFEIGESD